ncbi:MAG: PAS domain S-box protein [Porticoccaceae bacterium]|nr:PAS domain S-box protein [Porticoccaceae bacterium]
MNSELYLQALSLAGLLYLLVFLCSIYVWRISSLRLVWVGVGGAALLSAILRLVTLLDMKSQEFLRESYSWLSLIDLSIPILLLAGAGFALPVIKTYSRRLELAEDNQKALEESEEKYREMIESTGAGYVILDARGNVLECNESYIKLLGRSGPEEVIGHNLSEWVDESSKGDFVVEEMAQHSGCELRIYDGLSYLNPDGTPIPVEIYSRGRQTADGLRIVGLVRDVSQREAVRKKLEASERQANLLFENAPISTAIFAPDGQFLRANKAHDQLWGVVISEEFPNLNLLEDEQANRLIGEHNLRAIFKGTQIRLKPFVYKCSEFNFANGRDNTILPMFFPLFDDEGVVESIVQMHIDLTERVAAEQQIREREGFYRALIESTNDGYALLEPDETVIDANAEYIRLTGHTDLSEIKGQISRQWVSGDMGLEELRDLLAAGGNANGVRCDYRHPDGTLIPAEVSATLVESSAGPQVVVLARDISERLESEGRLRQAQKMDAIGKLTGGVAHDFNNLLGVILGNTELALGNQVAQAAVGPYLEAILDATERGADLTHRLLAFSRQTPLAPKVLDINVALENVGALLQRLIGEDVDLILVTSQAIPNCEVDPGELENVIINLANNARDAMPSGGKLVIEANSMICESHNKMVSGGELAAGEYVVVSVSDSGTGIAADILHRVTDPFFTTKDVGKGTGLGLSMAYGFAKQSNGHLSIYSEAGEGTTVNIFIPAHAAEAEKTASREPSVVPRGNEKILLVEDDPALATMACHMLEVLGYRVEVADTVARAIDMYHQHADFDLLLSDMILPGGRNGRQLADELQAITPALKVMYMSGYTENAVLHHGRLDAGVVLLQKPFRTSDLSTLVRQVLDS